MELIPLDAWSHDQEEAFEVDTEQFALDCLLLDYLEE